MSTQEEKITVKTYNNSKNSDLENKNNNTGNINNNTKVEDVSFVVNNRPKYNSSEEFIESVKKDLSLSKQFKTVGKINEEYEEKYNSGSISYKNSNYEMEIIYDKGNVLSTEITDLKTQKKFYFNENNQLYMEEDFENKDGERIKYVRQNQSNYSFDHKFSKREDDYILAVENDFKLYENTDNYFYFEDALSINIRNDRYEMQKIKDQYGNIVETKILDLSNNKKYYYNEKKQLFRIDTYAIKPGMEPKFNKEKSAEKTYLMLNFYEEYNIELNKYSMGTINDGRKRVIRQYITPYTDGRNADEYIGMAMKSINSDKEAVSNINSDYEFYRNSKFEVRKIMNGRGQTLETQILDLRNNKKYYYNENKEIYRIDTYEVKPGMEPKFNKNKSAEDDYLLFNYSIVLKEDGIFHRVIKKSTLYSSEGSNNYLNSVKESFGDVPNWQVDKDNNCATVSNEKYVYTSYLNSSKEIYKYEIYDKVKKIRYYYNDKGQLYCIDNSNDNTHIEFSDLQATVETGENRNSEETYNYYFGKSSDGKEYMVMDNGSKKFYYSKGKYEIYDSNTGKCTETFLKTSDNKIVHYVYGKNSGKNNTDNNINSYTEVFTENGGYCREKYIVDENDLNNLKLSDSNNESNVDNYYNYYNGKLDILPTSN